jgi:hypothetical protein
MTLFNPAFFNAAWTYLSSGSPPLIAQFGIANAALLLLFMHQRGRKSKVDYRVMRPQLQMLTGAVNAIILFGETIYPMVQHAFAPFKGLISFI